MTRRVPVFGSVVLGLVFITGCVWKSDELLLKIVDVSAPAINCTFDPSCTVSVTDSTAPIPILAGGTNFLQSRTFVGKPGAPGSGLYGYEYRIDLRNAVETMVDVKGVETKYMPCLRSMTLAFGPVINTLDYNGDGKAGDQVYVVTSGGPGSIGLQSVERYHNKITFNFDSPVCAGGSHRQGDSTYFFGLVSAQPPRPVTATIKETAGPIAASTKLKTTLRYDVPVRAPQTSTAGG